MPLTAIALEVLGSHHGSGPGARRLPAAVVGDAGKPYQVLTSGTNARHACAMAEASLHCPFGVEGSQAYQIIGRKKGPPRRRQWRADTDTRSYP